MLDIIYFIPTKILEIQISLMKFNTIYPRDKCNNFHSLINLSFYPPNNNKTLSVLFSTIHNSHLTLRIHSNLDNSSLCFQIIIIKLHEESHNNDFPIKIYR